MDWLTLIVLIPLITVPLVLLTGFAGCSFCVTGACPTPADPTELTVTTVGSGRIQLNWKDNGSNTTHFEIRRSENGGDPIVLERIAARIPAPGQAPPIPNSFVDNQALAVGKSYRYQVLAVTEASPYEGCDGELEFCPEALSNPLNIGPLGWQTAFGPVTFNADQANWVNDCLVQRINAAGNLLVSGQAVRITLRNSDNAPLIVKRVYISQAAHPVGAGVPVDQLVDAPVGIASDLTAVPFGGDEGVFLNAGGSVTSDETGYSLDHTKDLLIAFDIGPQGGTRRAPKPGCQAYRSADSEQAAIEDRSNFSVQGPPNNPANGQPADTVYLVEKLEVLTVASA